MLIDSHCHLDHWDDDEHGAVLARAAAVGVAEVVTIGVRMAQSAGLIGLAGRHRGVWCTVGVHPENAAELPVPSADEIAALARAAKVVAIGESGLDYFHETAPRAVQAESFRQHIRAARLSGLPLVIHARAADDDMAQILESESQEGHVRLRAALLQLGPCTGGAGRGTRRVCEFFGHSVVSKIV